MSGIRPLEVADLDAIARLYERVMRSGGDIAATGLRDEFERTLFGHPWVDRELPSLVYEADDAGIVGFLGSHPRRLRLGSRDLRLACSGQLTAHPDFRRAGVGALLLRRYLAGPQDLTITDGATDAVRGMWEGLGGTTNGLASMSWTRVFRPASFAAAIAERRRGSRLPGATVAGLADRVAARPLTPAPAAGDAEPLTPGAYVELLGSLERSFPLRPAHTAESFEWLLGEAAAVRARGSLRARLVRVDGRPIGSFVFYAKPGGIAQALSVVAAPRDASVVLDRLFADAFAAGCAALSGRVEPHLHAALRDRRCLFRRGEWALVHGDADALSALAYGEGLLTRLEGEWWMGHHLG